MTRPASKPFSAPASVARRKAVGKGALSALWVLGATPLSAVASSDPRPGARLRWRLERAARNLEVGDAIIVRLEVWVSTWFQAPVEFPTTLKVEGALVEAIGGSPDSTFEEWGGRRWTGLIRRYRVLPLQPGAVSVGLPGHLMVVPGGGGAKALRLAPPKPLAFEVRVPKGAEDIQPFVAARQLSWQQRWWPETGERARFQVGDLVRREVVLITDSTSPLLPAPDFGHPSGVGVRVQAAQSSQQRAHAAATPTLTRRHEVTYELREATEVVLPALELVWWDIRQRRRRVSRLGEWRITVEPAADHIDPFAPPAASEPMPSPASPAQPDRSWLKPVGWGGLGLTLTGLAWRLRPARGKVSPLASWRESAAWCWARLQWACWRNDAEQAQARVWRLREALGPQAWQRLSDDRDWAVALENLWRHLHGPQVTTQAAAWQGADLARAARAQRARLSQATQNEAAGLPTLHP